MLQGDTAVGAIIIFLFSQRGVLFLSLEHHRVWWIYSETIEHYDTKFSREIRAMCLETLKKRTPSTKHFSTREMAVLRVFTFAVVEKLLCEDRYIKDSSVLPFCIFLLIAKDSNK